MNTILCVALLIIVAVVYFFAWALMRASALADERTDRLLDDESWHDNSSGVSEDWRNHQP